MPSTPTVVAGGARRPSWAIPSAVFLISFAVYALTISRNLWTTDVFGADWTSWHIIRSGSPWIDGSRIPELGHRSAGLLAIAQTHNGHTAFGRFPGVVAVSLPAYLLSGSAHFSTVPASLTAAFLTACALVLMCQALRRYLADGPALIATALFGFTTPVWTISANQMWPHTITVFAIAGMAWAAATNRWWSAGVFGGIGLWGRTHVALIIAVLGLGVAIKRRAWGPAVRMGIASGAFLLATCWWVHWMYGTWNPLGAYGGVGSIGQSTSQYQSDIVNQLGMWVSPDRGILVWTPVVLLLLPALVRSWRDLPDWSRSLLAGGLLYTVASCAMNTFTGGDGFYGYRYGLEFLACATPALALSYERMGRLARTCLGPVIGVQFFAFLLGAVEDNAYLPQTAAWHQNVFVHTVDRVGPYGWLVVGFAAVLGWLAARRLARSPQPPATPHESELPASRVPA